MKYLIDTNVISELRRPDRAHPAVVSWAKGVETETLFISVVSLMELRHGALLIQRRDPQRGRVLLEWIYDRVIPDFLGRTLMVDTEVSLGCAALHGPNPRGEHDAWIAATALVHNLTVVTRNTRDFQGTGVRLLNPWLA